MSFITRNDLLPYIRDEHIDDIATWTEYQEAIDTAVDYVKSYLENLYDVEDVFAKVEKDRNKVVVRCCLMLALYDIQQRLPNRKIASYSETAYTETIAYLEKVNKGAIKMNIKEKILPNNEIATVSTSNTVIKRRN